jgi:hypothetical protein
MATTTPNYGWDVPTSTDYVKDGATAIETLGDDIDATLWTALGGAYPGMRLVKKQTVGSAVSSVTVSNAFSATYENYRIIYSGGVGTGTGEFNFSLGGITTLYYSQLVYGAGSSPLAAAQSGVSSFFWAGSTLAGSAADCTIDITSPFASKIKTYKATLFYAALGNSVGYVNSTASATDFTLTPTAGTLTGGTIYVYGYGAS